ncbi:MAG TPA: tRNA(His) guanylyltransferase Thg1 family protein [Cyclobacteriaceae bacterium]
MKFEMLDKKMRAFEENLNQFVLPEVYIVARLDGRGFTRLTKELLLLEKPFDETFRDAMIETVSHLMNCGFKITYGYYQSDEISILFDKNENGFARKIRKLLSILSGEASAKFTSQMGAMGVFDCRIIPLPTEELVVDYFRWRSEDASRNALNAWCYWTLRKNGASVAEATKKLEGKSVAYKNQFLFENDINYNDLPAWQKRGIGFRYETVETSAVNPKTENIVSTSRKKLNVEMTLPLHVEYESMIKEILVNSNYE